MLSLLLLLAAGLQDPAPADPPPSVPPAQDPETDTPEVLPDGEAPELSPQMAEILEIIHKVRDGFARVDEVLVDARDAADQRQPDADQGVSDKLDSAASETAALVRDMEELLEKLPQSDDSSSSSSGGSSSSNSSGNPHQQDDSGQSENQESESPKPSEQDGQEPKDGQEGGETDQLGGEQMPETLRELMLMDLRIGAWGMLPIRLQESLENSGTDDLPLRYRRWLEEYHRRGHLE